MAGQDIDESQDNLGAIKNKAHTAGHTVASTVQHTFPGGTADYLRADGTFATPPTGSGTPSGTATSGTAYGTSNAAGTSSEYSRGDHQHGTVADLVTGTAHATLTNVHGAGTIAEFHGLISVSGTAVTGTSQVAANTIGIAVIEGIVRATAAGSIQLQAAAEAAGTVWVMNFSVGLLYTIA